MHTLRTHASIHHTTQHHPDPTLRKLISRRIEELTAYTEDLAELIHILILEPSDTLTTVDVQLGFSLGERPIDKTVAQLSMQSAISASAVNLPCF
jgi:ribosome-associated translation inhibitor RaiA